MKKCCYCRSELPETKPGCTTEVQCEKCKKNEAKYKRKPTICMYCQLPAAFVDNKCVWCCYSERKNGPPVPCAQCKLRAAFPKDSSQKDKVLLCRMCLMAHKAATKNAPAKSTPTSSSQYNNNNSATNSTNNIYSNNNNNNNIPNNSTNNTNIATNSNSNTNTNNHNNKNNNNGIGHSKHHKRKGDELNGNKHKIAKSSQSVDVNTEHNQSEHILILQQHKDEIHELQMKCNEKDRNIIERDKKIAALSAEMMQLERDNKAKILQMQKQHQDLTQSLYEQIRILNKQIRQLQKGN